MEFMRGKRLHQNFQNTRRTDLDENYFCFDIDFDEREPDLNQVSQISEMIVKAQKWFLNFKRIDILACCLIAEHFHFELESISEMVEGQYSGAGHILCDLKLSHPAYDALLSRLSESSVRFYFNGHLISERIED